MTTFWYNASSSAVVGICKNGGRRALEGYFTLTVRSRVLGVTLTTSIIGAAMLVCGVE
jgi:hypothetical protein